MGTACNPLVTVETCDTGHLFLFSQAVKFRLAMLTEVPKEDRPLQTPELRGQNKPCSSSLHASSPVSYLPITLTTSWLVSSSRYSFQVEPWCEEFFQKCGSFQPGCLSESVCFISEMFFCVHLLCFNLHKEKESSFLLEAKQPPVKTNCVGRGLMLSLGGIQQEESKCS